jgi:hypothetical protein
MAYNYDWQLGSPSAVIDLGKIFYQNPVAEAKLRQPRLALAWLLHCCRPNVLFAIYGHFKSFVKLHMALENPIHLQISRPRCHGMLAVNAEKSAYSY